MNLEFSIFRLIDSGPNDDDVPILMQSCSAARTVLPPVELDAKLFTLEEPEGDKFAEEDEFVLDHCAKQTLVSERLMGVHVSLTLETSYPRDWVHDYLSLLY